MSVDNAPEAFVDTNVWLYAFLADDRVKQQTAAVLIRGVSPVVSAQVVNEVCVNLIRKGGFDGASVRQVIHEFYQRCRVVPLDKELLLDAAELRDAYSLSYWDSLIVAAADRAGVTALHSEDLQDGLVVRQRLTISNPFGP